ncbi:MAG: HEAT repeat domain-containing protein [Gemmataceae bacterium]|nr:HEAT repeat domain-containing protein [Gemmataceae bacterium]MCI0739587.1 HEAT repeat domain-containing protein [Gemmataceae bacterium]
MMSHFARRWLPSLFGLFLASFLCSQGAAPVRAADPVEELRKALPVKRWHLDKPSPQVVAARRQELTKLIENLANIGDLRRALGLQDWKRSAEQLTPEVFREMDVELRKQIGDRLVKGLRRVIDGGDANSKLAAANLIAEMGPTVQSLTPGDKAGFARGLTPEVLLLVKDKDLGVRQEGLRALGSIFAKPEDAVPVFRATLKSDAVGPRRLAADGLAQLVRVAAHLQQRPGETTRPVEATRADVFAALKQVIPACSAGFHDEDPEVRHLCLGALQVSTKALGDLIPDGAGKDEFPTGALTDEQRADIQRWHQDLSAELKAVEPVAKALQAQSKSLAQALDDPDVHVKLAAMQALESIGNARIRLRRRVLSVPLIKGEGDGGNRALLAQLDTLESFVKNHLDDISKYLTHQDVRLRRGAVEFLEIIEDAATPATPLLAASLNDPDRFVRWSAVRALGAIPLDKATVALPNLAKLMSDPDLSVRKAAAEALEFMGPAASAAVPEIASAVSVGDSEARIAAMFALQSIGAEHGKAAVPNLIDALGHEDHRVRKAAAETLGRFGPAALLAVPALRRALGDEDAGVRAAASDAILSILPPR